MPKALIQPNLSILAEVDPTNAIAEANETDNDFPASGTPLAIDVRTASTFNVRFVPVQVAGRLGNVTSGNKNQFLADAMKLHPLPGVRCRRARQFPHGAAGGERQQFHPWIQS